MGLGAFAEKYGEVLELEALFGLKESVKTGEIDGVATEVGF